MPRGENPRNKALPSLSVGKLTRDCKGKRCHEIEDIITPPKPRPRETCGGYYGTQEGRFHKEQSKITAKVAKTETLQTGIYSKKTPPPNTNYEGGARGGAKTS